MVIQLLKHLPEDAQLQGFHQKYISGSQAVNSSK